MQKTAVFAVDIGGSKLLCGLVTPEGEILNTEKRLLGEDVTTEFLEDTILELRDLLLHRTPDTEITACGMTIPGVADAKNGIWTYACFSGISDYRIAEIMREKLGVPVYIENDGNACAWAEKVFGNCKDCDDFLWVTVSNGVGGGMVLNGRIYRGVNEGAGEIGHLIVEKDGRTCPCGHKGCLEAMAAGPGIAKRYFDLTGEEKSAAELSVLAKAGDETAAKVMKDTGIYIGRGLGKAACILNLKRYVLGGGVMQSFDMLIDDIRAAFAEEAFAKPNQDIDIIRTGLGYEAGLMGAAAVAVRPVFGS